MQIDCRGSRFSGEHWAGYDQALELLSSLGVAGLAVLGGRARRLEPIG